VSPKGDARTQYHELRPRIAGDGCRSIARTDRVPADVECKSHPRAVEPAGAAPVVDDLRAIGGVSQGLGLVFAGDPRSADAGAQVAPALISSEIERQLRRERRKSRCDRRALDLFAGLLVRDRCRLAVAS